jgi:hypothetical protein
MMKVPFMAPAPAAAMIVMGERGRREGEGRGGEKDLLEHVRSPIR